MKDKSKSGKFEPETERLFGINYQWVGADGEICRHHTSWPGRDYAHACRRFFNDHRHVAPAVPVESRLEAA